MPPFTYAAAAYADSPGVYLMKDDRGQVIYVGKAKSLRKRLSSYFQDLSERGNVNLAKTRALVASIRDIDTISTNTEREALLLENELIKLHQPAFNSRLKDDKSFPYVMVTCGEPFPRVQVIRGVHLYPPGNLFFGPYTDKGSVIKILRVLRRIFPYCTCSSEIPRKKCKPCLYHHMNLCPAPCARPGDDDFRRAYLAAIKNVILFLRGDYAALLGRLRAEMEAASKAMDFERAAALRDKLAALEKMFRPQSVISPEYPDLDTITLAKNDEELAIIVMEIREGRLINKIPFIYTNNASPDDEVLGNFVTGYYNTDKASFPRVVLLNKAVDDPELVRDVLARNSGGRVEEVITGVAAGGDGAPEQPYANLLDMGRKNAFFLLHKRRLNRDLASFDHQDALQDLARELDLERVPSVVEGYDISNIQGKFATGSKVCFKDGKPFKSEYRRFRIQSAATPDDFRMMAELVSRRFARVVEGRDVVPDLVVIDGGKGQLNAALEQLGKLGLEHLSIIGLAKKEEEIYVPDEAEPIVLPRDSKALLFLRRVRDESHRFALKYHHKVASTQINALDDALKGIGGIGEKRAATLRNHFKTLDAIKGASLEELEVVVRSRKAASAVYGHFRGGSEGS
ncbi:MAG: excinuclease ABC subunit UvrC [Candidatus Lokiarchaeota archaeon]|nr:excinuclease ABC subunit UvrC [Candidatus Lokiarchaeota archaeon]